MTKIEYDYDHFIISQGETISVNITKSVAPYSAAVGDLTGGTWAPIPSEHVQGVFTAPMTTGAHISFSILFSFIPGPVVTDPTKDFYTVTFSGTGPAISRRVFAPSRSYLFTVV